MKVVAHTGVAISHTMVHLDAVYNRPDVRIHCVHAETALRTWPEFGPPSARADVGQREALPSKFRSGWPLHPGHAQESRELEPTSRVHASLLTEGLCKFRWPKNSTLAKRWVRCPFIELSKRDED